FVDNSRGPVLPVLCEQLKIPYETAGLFLMVGNLAAVLATFTMGRILPRFGEWRAAIAVSWIAILPGLLAPFVESRWRLLGLGLLLGASVSLVGSLSSILTVRGTTPQTRSRVMSMQQVMYGLGSFAAPLLFSSLTYVHAPWWSLFSLASASFFFLGLLFIWLLPREEKAHAKQNLQNSFAKFDINFINIILVFMCYVAGEVLASMWMNSLLVDKHGLAPEVAAHYQVGFFILIGLTRFLCFLFVGPRLERLVLVTCLLFGSFFAFLGQQGFSWALPLIGVLGPFFPLTMARVSVQFPKTWQSMMIYIYVSIQTVLALMHFSVGRIADRFGLEQAFLLSPLCLMLSLGLLIPILKKQNFSKI
ncbi:MAG: MFS transporter, partial [Proteobacteria bacterium]|nr:MFS transporter [Pseudomonadota bacterium]